MTKKYSLTAVFLSLLTLSSSVSAQLFPGPGLSMVTIGRYASFRATINDLTAQTTYSGGVWSGVDFGPAAASRIIVLVCTGAAGNRTFASATIGGIAAAKQIEIISAANATTNIITAAVPTGATGNISYVWSAAQSRMACAVYALYGASSATAVTTSSDGTAGASSYNINITAGNVLIAGTSTNTGVVTPTGYTEAYAITTTGAAKIEGGSYFAISSETPRTVSDSYTGSPTINGAVAATFH